ncbi:MAG: chromosome segregation protein SMC [Betaproteobacteria bacterium]|nr:chromosome segregation protein SMC [Betaproteobacteria bacterium]
MRLTQINLAGFKSFVDPTRIPVPGQLVGVVGPNGCGKSNVIDAVRWVLGETSARHLRGETMQDVLFNGSGERKPVNRASVELIFDNSLGKAAGQWSKYAEISIKRVLQRDGDSSYYINNIHVRRRDVADIFLGTGLGSRAYAIIEQGMISRVIEAKPEELRVFLEEAAGVSKYRERRRETELRLKDTRENLLRVDDIRQELDKQIEHLQTQAEVARRYHALHGELQTTQSLLWLTRKQEAAASRNRYAREIERLGIELEAETAKLREAEKRLEEMRSQHYRASDEMHAAQGALYEANAEVARLEQQIAHVRDSRNRIEHQLATVRSQLEHNESQLAAAHGSLGEWRSEKSRAEEQVAGRAALVAQEGEKLPVAEETYRATNTRRDELQRSLAGAEQALQVEQTKLAHAERLLEQLAQRGERLLEEQASLQGPDAAAMDSLRQEMQALEQALHEQRATLAQKERLVPQLEEDLRGKNDALDAATQCLTGIEARIHALQQLQDRLARGAQMEAWLAARELDRAPRLWQGITIEAGWEDALEAVLRERLNGIALDSIEQCAAWLGDAPPGKMTVVGAGDADVAAAHDAVTGCEPLVRHVTCRDSRLRAVLAEWLHDVFVVVDAAAGMSLRERLPLGALLVTREGHAFTRHSVSFHAPDSELHGVLSRQREIEQLQETIGRDQAQQVELKAAAAAAEREIEQRKAESGALRQAIDATQLRHHSLQIEALRLSEQAQRLTQRGEQVSAELEEIAGQTATETGHKEAAAANLERLTREAGEFRAQLDLATDLYRRAEAVLELQRAALQEAQREHQEASFRLRTSESKISEIESSINVLSENISSLGEALTALQSELAGYDEKPWQEQLQQALSRRSERTQALAHARDGLEGMESQLKEVEQERLACEQKLDPLRGRIGEIRLKEQEARLVEDQFTQQLAQAGAREEELRALLEKGTRSGALQGEINRLTEEIKGLGAVNLAALEELQTAQERKNYLDAQSRDLSEAMTTLEDAIRRIDRETRERLQQTFDEVNGHFGQMFPALFGGGVARLVLSGEEILDSGVQVIAQPPGKKNTTIHLLSGGEKALTALALVFSIFQLNPAPFCLLDEVDAPLDDHNTERFCDLVRKMSEQSQFLFISHNKITMEIAHQLLGITMQEPGVSRVVAVDIEEAMKLTEEAVA